MHDQVGGAHSRTGWSALAALLAVTALAYLNSLSGPFQFDDYAGPATDSAAQGWAAWWETLAHRIRPLLKASYVATHHLGEWLGHATLGHHIGGLLIHLGAVVLAWRLAFVMARSFGLANDVAGRAALGCAGLFALHPLATEAITYISGRSVALGMLFALATALAQLEGRRVLAFVAFVAALSTREAFIVIPALLVLLEWARRATPSDAIRRTAWAWIVAALTVAALLAHRRYAPLIELSTQIVQGRADSPSLLLPLEYFVTRLFLLAPLSIDPSLQPERIGTAHRVVASLIVGAALVLAWRHRTTRPWWVVGLGWGIVVLVPMYLVPLRHDGVSERHFYPVLWGAGFALSCEAATRLRPGVAMVAACAAALVLSTATMLRNADYSSEVTLWEATSRAPGAAPRAFNNLGVAYLGEARVAEARTAFDRALALDAGYTKARQNRDRAIEWMRTGNPLAEPEI